MSNHLLIYLIVLLNVLCQSMLIWRQKSIGSARWAFLGLAAAIPLGVMGSMRSLIALGIMHGRVVEQSGIEHVITQAMSIMLIAGPWLATLAAVLYKQRQKVAGHAKA